MAGENDQQDEQLTPEQEAAAEAEFMAAFNQTREQQGSHVEGSTSTEPTANANATGANGQPTPSDEDAAAQAQAQAQAAADAEAARLKAEAEAPAQLTQQQLRELQAQLAAIPQLQEEIRRTRDTTAGKLGSIQQQMQTLAQQAAAGQRPALKELKRLKAEFPELGQMLEEDLSEAFGSTHAGAPGQQGDQHQGDGTQPPAHVPVDPLTDARVQQALRQKDMAIVDVVHPDWRDLKATPEFAEWRTNLPPAAQQLLATTWDPQVMVDAFKDFKTWKGSRAEQAAAQAAQAAAQAAAGKQRDRRLADATPATTGAPTGINAVDDDAAFMEGFNKVRKA